MKSPDKQTLLEYLQGMFRDPSSHIKAILEDGNWKEGGIDWENDEEVEQLRREIYQVLEVVFDKATVAAEEILKP